MSRRFGRNQRRRAREALKEAVQQAEQYKMAWERECGLLRHTSRQLEQLQATMDEARFVLGDSIALPPRDGGKHPIPDGGDFDTPSKMDLALDVFMREAAMADPVCKVDRMHTLMVGVKNGMSTPGDDSHHIRLQLASGEIVYALSTAAIHCSPEDWMVARVAHELARQLSPLLVASVRKSRVPRSPRYRIQEGWKP